MNNKFYVFIVSSLNSHIYTEIQNKRRILLKKYNIPYTILINHTESNPLDTNITTFVPLQEDEILYPISGYSPYMSQKFLNAVKLYFRTFSSWDEVPNYIIRINATTYINFPDLINYLNTLPKEKVLAGPIWAPNTFVVGMIMIFSKDVLLNMIKDPRVYVKAVMNEPDDVTLSMLAKPYSTMYDMMPFFVYPHQAQNNGVYNLNFLKPKKHNKWLFRIRHEENRQADIVNWDNLMNYYENPSTMEAFTKLISYFI